MEQIFKTQNLLTLDTQLVASSAQVSSDMDGETIILSLVHGVYYSLDGVGAYIWKLLQSPSCIRAVYSAVLSQYEVEAQQCEHDLFILLNDLVKVELLEVIHEPGR